MKLLVKNLHNEEFRVDCDGGDSIKELKEIIAKQTTIKEKYDPELIKLLHKGKVMDDEDAVDKYSIDAEDYVVLVKQLPGKPKPPPKKKPQYPNFNNPMGMGAFGSNGFGGFGGFGGLGPGGMMQNPFQHTPFGGASSYPQPTYNPSAAAASTTTTTNQSAYVPSGGSGGFEDVHPEAFSTEEDREGALRTLTGMGFEENIAEKALRATFYNVEAAVDYITSGKVYQSSTPSTPKSTASNQPTSIPTAKPKPTSSASSGDGGMTAQLQQISQMLRDNPEQLQMIKQTLAAEHPEVAQMIDDNPQAFLSILQQVTDGTNSNAQPNSPTSNVAPAAPPSSSTQPTITLSNHDQQIIEQLQAMGFDRERAVEAYLLADRNQEMAINILLG